MARKIMILALVFFAMVCMASAIDYAAAALKDAADAPIPVENNSIIGTINGSYENGAVAAAPVGAPISGNTFPNITLPPAPNTNGATTSTPDFITIATTIVSAAVAGSFFF
ncbi:uncharacterized protein LOC132066609 [Lycium ferocissimum]|uniref:uncharacterized protein LOC132066609 n=1 Tax=Lycium ferocissimum TaxID=112874 RepID=UPI002815F576|nr:uncharacterized protein LOC132066609 [Lycium ferocissimum]